MAVDYLFRRVHCTKNYIHMNLMISMVLLYVFTLVHNPVAESFLKFKYYEDKRTHHRLMVSGKSFYSSCIFGQLVENHHKLFEVFNIFSKHDYGYYRNWPSLPTFPADYPSVM